MKNFLFVFAAIVALFTGCAEFQSGDQPSDSITEPRFFFGELRYTEISSIEKTWRGVKAAVKDLNFNVESREQDLLQATIIAVGEGKEIKIHLEENSPTTTEIRIRAGKIGDKRLAEKVMLAIRKHL